jgi:importin subunit alpha-1
LTNICSGTTQQTEVVVNAGVIPIFVEFVASRDIELKEQALWALANIAADAAEYRDMILANGGMPILLSLLSNTHQTRLSLIRNGAFLLGNMCHKHPLPFEAFVPALPIMSALLNMSDAQVIQDICSGVAHLAECPRDNVETIIAFGLYSRLIELLDTHRNDIMPAVLTAIGNIVIANVQVPMDQTVLSHLSQLLQGEDHLKETCCTISKVVCGSSKLIQTVIDMNVIPRLIVLIKTASDIDVRKESARFFFRASGSSSPEQLHYFISQGYLPPMNDLMMATYQDQNHLMETLRFFEKLLAVGRTSSQHEMYRQSLLEAGVLVTLNKLIAHDNREVSQLATQIQNSL